MQDLDGCLLRLVLTSFKRDELSDEIVEIRRQRSCQNIGIEFVQTGTNCGTRPAIASATVHN